MHPIAAAVAASPLCPMRLRLRLLRAASVRAKSCHVYPGVRVTANAPVRIGERTFINRDALIDNCAPVTIGDDVQFGPGVALITSTHELAGPSRRGGERVDKPIVIGDGCWLGARVTVLPGVTIGRGSVIAAGAVVAADLEEDGLYGGVPAKLIRRLSE